MSYTALYRVWRPGTFSEVVGQNHISQTLRNAVQQNRVTHAYLFSGPRGTGKTSLAKIMGKALNCLNLKDGEPCNECQNCQGINEGSFLDYFEIDAASNRGIDEIRDMRERVKFTPSQGRTKVYVIDEVHMLTNEAFNALLKTLEEPPEHVVFILATTEPHKIPLTILSRCQRYDFKKIFEEGIKERLKEIIAKENLKVEENALDLIVRKAEGGMRDAISILDQGISATGKNELSLAEVEEILGTLNEEQLYNIFFGTFKGEPGNIFSSLDNYLAEGKDIKQIVKDMTDYLREIILYKVSGKGENKKMKELSEMKDLKYFNALLKDLIEGEQKMYFFSRPRIILEALLMSREEGQKEEKKKVKTNEQVAEKPTVEKRIEIKEEVKNIPDEVEGSGSKNLWEDVLNQVKKEKIILHACLIEGSYAFEDGVGKVIFPENKKFHQERVSQKENLDLLEKIFEKKYNKKVKIISVLEGNGKVDPVPKIQEVKKEIPESKPSGDALEEALKIFNAEVVEIKD